MTTGDAQIRDRDYTELDWPQYKDAKPAALQDLEGQEAVDRAHEAELGRIADGLGRGQSVLVIVDKEMAPFLLQALQSRVRGSRWEEVTINVPPAADAGTIPGSSSGRLTQRLAQCLSEAFHPEGAGPVVVVRHLDLMTWTAGDQPRPELNDVVYWMSEFRNVTKLAFWDPSYRLPKVIEDLFEHRVTIEGFRREVLWRLVRRDEARKVSKGNFALSAQLELYQYLSGLNVVDVRRVLRGLRGPAFREHEGLTGKVAEHIREHTTTGGLHRVVGPGRVAGYDVVRQRLKREILFPFQLRCSARDELELRRADELIPRGVIFAGPPGTGKSEWSKELAHELRATLQVVHGPELKHRLVGETEEAIRRLFAQARRSAPSVILIDEIDSLTPVRERSGSHFENSMVAQFLAEMDGLRHDEAVLVVGTTNWLDAVDPAFLRPGRFGMTIEIDYPGGVDRRAIIDRYNGDLGLGLTPASIARLVEKTAGPLDPDRQADRQMLRDAYIRHVVNHEYVREAGPLLQRELNTRFGLHDAAGFSGDHLRAVCLYLLREKLDRTSLDRPEGRDVNEESLWDEAIQATRCRVRSAAGPSISLPVQTRGSSDSPGSRIRF